MANEREARVTWHEHSVTQAQREQHNGHRGCVVWFTGLSGCGKSTVANLVDAQLHARGVHSYLLDGDNVRHALNASPALLAESYGEAYAQRFGLAFSPEDRQENIRRIGAVGQLFASAGIVTLAAFVSPYRSDRQAARTQVEALGGGRFIEVFVDAPLDVCEGRDPKGLYKLARAGKIQDFTGIDAPYEAPESPELHLRAGQKTPDQLAREVVAELERRELLRIA